MNKVRITVMKTVRYDDLIEKYENPITDACDMREGMVFVANGWRRPEGFCESAWRACRRLSWRSRTAAEVFTTAG